VPAPGLREVTHTRRDGLAQAQHRGMLLKRRGQPVGLAQAGIEATAHGQRLQ
jgi:hypothetical protein